MPGGQSRFIANNFAEIAKYNVVVKQLLPLGGPLRMSPAGSPFPTGMGRPGKLAGGPDGTLQPGMNLRHPASRAYQDRLVLRAGHRRLNLNHG